MSGRSPRGLFLPALSLILLAGTGGPSAGRAAEPPPAPAAPAVKNTVEQTTLQREAERRQEHRRPAVSGDVLVLAAGGSVYQAGVALAVMGQLRGGGPQDEGPARPERGQAEPGLASIVGSSSGGVNALLAALTYCQSDTGSYDPERTPLWALWSSLSWERLFPGDLTCHAYQKRFPDLEVSCSGGRPYTPADGVLTLNGVSEARRALSALMSDQGRYRKNCGPVPFALPLLAEDPVSLRIGKHDFVQSARRYLSGTIRTTETGALQICDLPAPAPPKAGDAPAPRSRLPVEDRFAPQRRLGFPLNEPVPAAAPPAPGEAALSGDTAARVEAAAADPYAVGVCRQVAPTSLFEAMLASMAVPPFFEPQTLAYCGTTCPRSERTGYHCPTGQHLCEGRFVDGGIFDSLPLSVGRNLAGGEQTQFILVDPQPAEDSPAARLGRRPELPPGLRGVTFYLDAISKFVEVTTDYELQTVRRHDPSIKEQRIQRRAPTFGDYLFHHGSFLDGRFTRYDFYTGIYEGLRWVRGVRQKAPGLAAFLAAYGAELGVDVAGRARPAALPPVRLSGSRPLVYVVLAHLEGDECRGSAPADATLCAAVGRRLATLRALPEVSDFARLHAVVSTTVRHTTSLSGLPLLQRDFAEVAERLRTGPHALPDADALPFVAHYPLWYAETQRQAAARLEVIEREQGETGSGVVLASYQYAQAVAAGRERSGWFLGSGTIPQVVLGSALVADAQRILIPHTFRAEFIHGGLSTGWEVLGLQASGGGPVLRAGADLRWLRHARVGQGVNAGPTLSLAQPVPLAFIWELGLRTIFPLRGRALDHFAAELFVRPLWGRLELAVGARLLADERARGVASNHLFVSFGLADLNGTLYWLLR